jgi:hypothetical protein
MAAGPMAAHADDAAPSASGHVALELASILGTLSPSVTAPQKTLLSHYLIGHSSGHGAQFMVKVKQVQCGAGDVSIVSYNCDITFGATHRTLTARAAHELLATLEEAGVQGDGAAGTIYYSLTDLRCTLVPSDIADNGGGGASCVFKTDSAD